VKEDVTADSSAPKDEWQQHELVAEVPADAVEARVAIVLTQPSQEKGAVFVDGVELDAVSD
jgi:hypothetical protein